jgi:hypothetical protein
VDSIGSGNSGTIRINAGSIFLDNRGGITASSIQENSSGGFIDIRTDILRVNDSNISASTRNGRAGNLTVKATGGVLLNGTGGLSVEATAGGTAGSLTVETGQMTVFGGAEASVSSTSGQAGNLKITVGSLTLDRGFIFAETSRSGANIVLDLSNFLRLENQSLISATAEGDADGGNITIDALFTIAFPRTGLDGSDILARADRGDGGNININASGIFGIEENKATPGNRSNDIDASSRSGLPGRVEIKTTLDPTQNTVQFTETVVDPATLVSRNSCRRRGNSEFTVAGRGGLPPTASDDLGDTATDVPLVEPVPTAALKPTGDSGTSNAVSRPEAKDKSASAAISPARGWVFNERGEVILVTYDPLITGAHRGAPEGSFGCPVP